MVTTLRVNWLLYEQGSRKVGRIWGYFSLCFQRLCLPTESDSHVLHVNIEISKVQNKTHNMCYFTTIIELMAYRKLICYIFRDAACKLFSFCQWENSDVGRLKPLSKFSYSSRNWTHIRIIPLPLRLFLLYNIWYMSFPLYIYKVIHFL